MWKMTIFKRKRPGFALVFTVLIALAMIIPVMILASNAISRRKAVSRESVSDRILSIADATIDKTLNKINTFNFTFTTPTVIYTDGDLDTATKEVQDYLIAHYISLINGGVPDPDNPVDSLNSIKKNLSTYLYNFKTQHYYAVWDDTNNNVAPVSTIGPNGDIKTEKIKDLNTGEIYDNIMAIPPDGSNYKTNNLWVEIDVRADYDTDEWIITDTAYSLSNPKIKRTIKSVAKKGNIATSQGEVANGSWYRHDTTTVTLPGHSFADYSGLYHTKVYFGQFEITRGPIRSDSNLYMGGWAEDPVYANNTVYDKAVDDHNGNHDGRFGPDKKNLTWAKANGYATDGYPAADWANVDNALYGTNAVRNSMDPNGGIQDIASSDYYVKGDATIVFSVVSGVGKVSINNGPLIDMPANGAIFVEGTATVSGTIKGQCSVGASKINIGGNIIYNTPPRLDRNAPIPQNPDLLGLISHGDITITATTFNANHHLEIDAAMISKAGNFGIDSTAPSHTIDPLGTYEAWWNGCQASWNTSNAPAMYLGKNKVRGYEIQHTNYDWNLRDYGVPPYYPTTSKTGESVDTVDQWPVVSDTGILNHLTSLTKEELDEHYKLSSPIDIGGNVHLQYKVNYNGVDYYYGNTFGWGATATMQKTELYRISWKEQIGQPVVPNP